MHNTKSQVKLNDVIFYKSFADPICLARPGLGHQSFICHPLFSSSFTPKSKSPPGTFSNRSAKHNEPSSLFSRNTLLVILSNELGTPSSKYIITKLCAILHLHLHVYLATVSILPDILEEKASLQFRLTQILFFAFGVAFMYGVCLLEEMDGGHGHGHSHGHHDHHAEEVHHDHHDHHDHGHNHHEL